MASGGVFHLSIKPAFGGFKVGASAVCITPKTMQSQLIFRAASSCMA
jgi:hypothetical protein